MSQRRESITNTSARGQSVSGPPQQETVKVAVLPPRLPPGMAAPTGLGPAEAFSWDERVNHAHNELIDNPNEKDTGARAFRRKIGFTTQRKKANDMPNFTFREVPYDTWRKHYAKDKEGNYRGTHAPAEDCLLKPEDVAKWRVEPIKTKGDQWTRGSYALPVYEEVNEYQELPQYQKEAPAIPEGVQDDSIASVSSSLGQTEPPRKTLIDGKTTEQILQEHRAKLEAEKKAGKKGWKNTVKRGLEFAAMAN